MIKYLPINNTMSIVQLELIAGSLGIPVFH